MNSFKNVLIAILLTAVIGLSAALVGSPAATSPVLGAASGTEHYNLESFRAGLVEGGGIYSTTTTASTETLTAAVLEKNRVIRFLGSAAAAAITVTLPASTTMSSVLPNAGDSRSWVIENGYGAAATTTTLAAGTGIDLQIPETTGADLVINQNNYGLLDCYREASSDIVCLVTETIPGD